MWVSFIKICFVLWLSSSSFLHLYHTTMHRARNLQWYLIAHLCWRVSQSQESSLLYASFYDKGSQPRWVCPQETFGNAWRHFLIIMQEGWGSVLLASSSRYQRCCVTSYSAQDGPPTKSSPAPGLHSARQESLSQGAQVDTSPCLLSHFLWARFPPRNSSLARPEIGRMGGPSMKTPGTFSEQTVRCAQLCSVWSMHTWREQCRTFMVQLPRRANLLLFVRWPGAVARLLEFRKGTWAGCGCVLVRGVYLLL